MLVILRTPRSFGVPPRRPDATVYRRFPYIPTPRVAASACIYLPESTWNSNNRALRRVSSATPFA